MKKIIILVFTIVLFSSVVGCEFIEEQIQKERERIESLNFVDFEANIPDRSVLIKITSDVDEQIIEEITINDIRYELVAQGDDWYLLEDIPVEKAYTIKNVYYRSDLGILIAFPIDYEITLSEGLNYLTEEQVFEIDDTLTLDDYTFTISEDTLIEITSDNEFTLDVFADWVWVVFEDETPLYVVFEYEEVTRVIIVPEKASEFIS